MDLLVFYFSQSEKTIFEFKLMSSEVKGDWLETVYECIDQCFIATNWRIRGQLKTTCSWFLVAKIIKLKT